MPQHVAQVHIVMLVRLKRYNVAHTQYEQVYISWQHGVALPAFAGVSCAVAWLLLSAGHGAIDRYLSAGLTAANLLQWHVAVTWQDERMDAQLFHKSTLHAGTILTKNTCPFYWYLRANIKDTSFLPWWIRLWMKKGWGQCDFLCLVSVLWVYFSASTLPVGMLAWLSVWSEVQIICVQDGQNCSWKSIHFSGLGKSLKTK